MSNEVLAEKLLEDLEHALAIIYKLSNYSGDHEWIKEVREKYSHVKKE